MTYFDDAQLNYTQASTHPRTLYAVNKPNLNGQQTIILNYDTCCSVCAGWLVLIMFHLSGNEQVVHLAGPDGGKIPSALHHVSSVFGPRYPKAEVRVDSFCDAVKNSQALKNNILDGIMK